MSAVLRLVKGDAATGTDRLQSCLWELGTTGVCELPSGDLLAGFESQSHALAVLGELETLPFASQWVATLEAASVDWAPVGEASLLKLAANDVHFEVVIDANQVFGHGRHATTTLALDHLLEVVRPGDEVLDIGTGSGVLAIVAAKIGARAVAIDIEPAAVEVALANAAVNHVVIECTERSLAETVTRYPDGFNCLAMNVLLTVHRQLARDAQRLVKPGGSLILSGFLEEQLAEVRTLYAGLDLVSKSQSGDWVGLKLRATRR